MNPRGLKVLKTPVTHNHPQTASAFGLPTPVLPQLPQKIRRMLDAAYAAHGGAERMTLEKWRDVEQQLKRKLENEYHERQP